MNVASSSAQIILWTCLVLCAYTYFVYPLCLWLAARVFAKAAPAPGIVPAKLPEVTLLVAAHNEERVIEEKILNSLALHYPSRRLNIVVASDGSTDATPAIVARYRGRGVRLLHYPERRGKSAVLNAAIAQTGGEILVLSDANTEYRPDAVLKLARWFTDPRVDTVCGRLLLRDPAHGTNVDGLYWRYETFMKKCEGRLGALLGANGAIYAIRRDAFVPIPGNTIIDDFVIPLASKLRHNGRIVYDCEAVAAEETPPTIASEFRRRIRIGTGAYQSLAILWKLVSPRYGWTALAFLSHKLLRWLVPFLLLAALVSNLLLLDHPFYQCVLLAQIAGYAGSLVGAFLPGRGLPSKLFRGLTMLAGMNLALLLGFCRYLTMKQTGIWHRTVRDLAELRPGSIRSPAPGS
jgi:cellulose synthase/poly-beta-1,6-N-acetylglucosamine synthase-like glycosyltransferase